MISVEVSILPRTVPRDTWGIVQDVMSRDVTPEEVTIPVILFYLLIFYIGIVHRYSDHISPEAIISTYVVKLPRGFTAPSEGPVLVILFTCLTIL